MIRRMQGLDGLLLATSDATADKLGIDRMEFRMSQGLKINPVGAPPSFAHKQFKT